MKGKSLSNKPLLFKTRVITILLYSLMFSQWIIERDDAISLGRLFIPRQQIFYFNDSFQNSCSTKTTILPWRPEGFVKSVRCNRLLLIKSQKRPQSEYGGTSTTCCRHQPTDPLLRFKSSLFHGDFIFLHQYSTSVNGTHAAASASTLSIGEGFVPIFT